MEERIRYIAHRGHRVLLVDLSHCSAAELARIARLVPASTVTEPPCSVLLLADFTGSEFDKTTIEVLKRATVFDRPHLKRSAWLVVETLPHVYYENIKSFSRRDLPTFKTREEALEWLVADEKPMASGQ